MINESYFRIAAFLLFALILGISITYRRRADRHGGRLAASGNRLLRLLRLAALIVLLPLLLYFIDPAAVRWAQWALPAWLRWSGGLLLLSTIPLFIWMFRAIGVNISPSHATREGQRLVTDGPYRYLRHPLYSFGVIAWIGLTLLTALWWLLLGVAAIAILIVYRTPKEEAELLQRFGADYEAYQQRTNRYWPRRPRQPALHSLLRR